MLTLIFTFIFYLLTKVDDWVGVSSQSWLGPLLFVRLKESCPVLFVLWVFSFVLISIYCFIEVREKLNFWFIGKKNLIFKIL